jgi:hypothetical protein
MYGQVSTKPKRINTVTSKLFCFSRNGRHVGTSMLPAASLYDDVQYLWTSSSNNDNCIQTYDNPPSGLDFLRNHVAVSRPCIIRNAIKDDANGQPLHITLDDLLEWQPHLTLNVNVTPDGHGDCLRRVTTTICDERNNSQDETNEKSTDEIFVKPMEVEMSIVEFVHRLRARRKHEQSGKSIECESTIRSAFMEIKDRIFLCSKETRVDDDDGRKLPTCALNDYIHY